MTINNLYVNMGYKFLDIFPIYPFFTFLIKWLRPLGGVGDILYVWHMPMYFELLLYYFEPDILVLSLKLI